MIMNFLFILFLVDYVFKQYFSLSLSDILLLVLHVG